MELEFFGSEEVTLTADVHTKIRDGSFIRMQDTCMHVESILE